MPRSISSTASTSADKPFVLLLQLHAHARLDAPEAGVAGQDRPAASIPTAWWSSTGYVGQLLKKLDDLGVANNTIVVFTTDNGAEVMSWPDGGNTPFRGEKATNWEGALPRADGHSLARRDPSPAPSINDILRARRPDTDLRRGGRRPGPRREVPARLARSATKTFKVHLDGYNLVPFFKGEVKESPRKEFMLLERRRPPLRHPARATSSSISCIRSTQGGRVDQGVHQVSHSSRLQSAFRSV